MATTARKKQQPLPELRAERLYTFVAVAQILGVSTTAVRDLVASRQVRAKCVRRGGRRWAALIWNLHMSEPATVEGLDANEVWQIAAADPEATNEDETNVEIREMAITGIEWDGHLPPHSMTLAMGEDPAVLEVDVPAGVETIKLNLR